MSAVERLAAATWGLSMDPPDAWRIASAILAADPTLAQDIEDGRALRELREALPDEWDDPLLTIQWYRWEGGPRWTVSPQDAAAEPSSVNRAGRGPTIAAAADACREALVAK